MSLVIMVLLFGAWSIKHRRAVAIARRSESEAIVADIMQSYLQPKRPTPLAVEINLMSPQQSPVSLPTVRYTRVYKFGADKDTVDALLVATTRAKGYCFDVSYRTTGPAAVKSRLCSDADLSAGS